MGIKISLNKGQDRIEVKEGVLKKGLGLEGDAYAKPGEREVCLMCLSTKDKLKDYQDGLCVKRFVESILIDLNPDDIKVGDILQLGEAEVLITQKGKRCFPECSIIQERTCPLISEPLFARVIKGGKISVK